MVTCGRSRFRSPPQQQRIVGLLDEAFAGIATAKANAEKNLQNACAIFDSLMLLLLRTARWGWARTKIGDQMTLQRGFDITKDQQLPGDVPVVSSGHQLSQYSDGQSSSALCLAKGPLRKVFFLDKDFWPHDTTLWVKDFKGNQPRFVYHFLSDLDVASFIRGPQILPSIETKYTRLRQLGHRVSFSVRLLRCWTRWTKKRDASPLYIRKLTALDDLKKALLHQAFTVTLRLTQMSIPFRNSAAFGKRIEFYVVGLMLKEGDWTVTCR